MPAFAPLFGHGGILGTAYRGHGKVAADADIAAYAFAYILQLALFDFFWQERIGNRRACCTDEIENTLFDLS